MTEQTDDPHSKLRASSANEARGLDSVDTCLRRLLSLRTRINTNWPITGRLFGRGPELKPALQATIADLLTSLPSPLPIHHGGDPEPIIRASDTDMQLIAGRAVDAAFALLDGADLETIYPAEVTLLATRGYDPEGPITVSGPTVGLLVATIIGTLEAISELVVDAPRKSVVKGNTGSVPKAKRAEEPKRGPVVPRI